MRSVAAPLLSATSSSSSSSRRPSRGRRKTAVASVASTNETETKEEDQTKRIAIVFGATGGVGQLVCAKLLLDENRRYDVVHAMCRNKETGEAKLKSKNNASSASSSSSTTNARLQVTEVDVREEKDVEKVLDAIMTEGGEEAKVVVDIVCCLGTTAFPSQRWKENNGPEQTDDIATANVIRAARKICFNQRNTSDTNDNNDKSRFVLISSVGVTRTDSMPYVILNLFGVLKYKRKSEKYLEQTQKENDDTFDYTIVRPGRLTDGPYTSYDLNTLLKATSSERRQVEIKLGDDFDPQETSRIAVADCVAFSLASDLARNKAFVIGTKEGDGGPERDGKKWETLFQQSLM
jgi:nucleoside-diphosphate-sugar epimerase